VDTQVSAPDVAGASSAPPIDLVPAPTAPLALKDYTPEQRQAWRLTGTRPDAPAASSTATAVEDPPASTDATPEPPSEAANAPQEYKAKTAKRIQELLDRVDRSERDLKALRAKQDAPPVSSTASAKDDPEPDATKYEDLPAFLRDHGRWSAREELRLAATAQQQHAQTEAAKAEIQQLQQSWDGCVAAAKAINPAFDVAAAERLIPAKSLIDAWIVQSDSREHGGALLNFLLKNPTEVPRLLALPIIQQTRELVKLEERALAGPSIKTVTSAPDPAPTLGTRATGGDPLTSAVKSGDFRAYRSTANSREVSARKGQ